MLWLALCSASAAGDVCLGKISVTGAPSSTVEVIRNTGCASDFAKCAYPTAAPANVSEDGRVELQLLKRPDGHTSRDGSRVYLGESCSNDAYNNSAYVAWQLLGRTLTAEVDLSAAGCGCQCPRVEPPRAASLAARRGARTCRILVLPPQVTPPSIW